MPAPTALLKTVAPPPQDVPLPDAPQDEGQLLEEAVDVLTAEEAPRDQEMLTVVNDEDQPLFPAAKDANSTTRRETRKVGVPPHRMSP